LKAKKILHKLLTISSLEKFRAAAITRYLRKHIRYFWSANGFNWHQSQRTPGQSALITRMQPSKNCRSFRKWVLS